MKDVIKVDFDDGSFILLESKDELSINIIMCGRKDTNTVTMSASSISKEQAEKINNFLSNWLISAKTNEYY